MHIDGVKHILNNLIRIVELEFLLDRVGTVISLNVRAFQHSILKKIRSQVGLSSIPCWCMPHHVLSTGQAYRATLARQLQHAAATGEVLLLRNFATVLDPLTVGCPNAAGCFLQSLERRLCTGGQRCNIARPGTRSLRPSCSDNVATARAGPLAAAAAPGRAQQC